MRYTFLFQIIYWNCNEMILQVTFDCRCFVLAWSYLTSYLQEKLHKSISEWVSSVQFSRSVVSNSLRPHEPEHARPPFPSPTPGVHPDPCLSSRWCHPTISSSIVPFSSCPQSFSASGSFPVSQVFTSGGQSIGVSASALVLPTNIHDWFPLGLTGLISRDSEESSPTP